MSRRFHVLNNGFVYRFGKREVLALLKAVALGGPPDEIGDKGTAIDFDLSTLTRESARIKYLEIIEETDLG